MFVYQELEGRTIRNILGIILIIIFVYLSSTFILKRNVMFLDEAQIKMVNMNDYKGYIDSAEVKDDIIILKGWAIKKGEGANVFLMKTVLKNENTQEYLQIPTQYHGREDITKYFNDGIDYHVSGFTSMVSGLKLQDGLYSIYILYDGRELLIDTGGKFRYVKGEMVNFTNLQSDT